MKTHNLYLICETDKDTQQEKVHHPIVASWDGLTRKEQKLVSTVCHNRDANGKVVSICLNEIMPCNGSGVYMVLAEWSYKALPGLNGKKKKKEK